MFYLAPVTWYITQSIVSIKSSYKGSVHDGSANFLWRAMFTNFIAYVVNTH